MVGLEKQEKAIQREYGGSAAAGAAKPPSRFHTEPEPFEVDRNELQELQETASGQMSELYATERRRMYELEGSGRGARF